MTHSADLAFFELARERELVSEQRLQEAMVAAERDRVPLERVLIQSGLLKPSVCEHLLQLRNRRALLCQSCGGYTYTTLSTQDGDVYCEHCGRLLRMSERQGGQDLTPMPPSAAPRTAKGRRPEGTGGSRAAPRGPVPRRGPPRRGPAPKRSAPRPAPLRGPTRRQHPNDEPVTVSQAMRRPRRSAVPLPRPAPRGPSSPGKTDVFLTRMIGRLKNADDPLVEQLIESAGAALARTVEERYLGGLEQRIADEVTGRVVDVLTRGEIQLPQVSQVAVDRAMEQIGLVADSIREDMSSSDAQREAYQRAQIQAMKADLSELGGALGNEESRLDQAAQERLQGLITKRLEGPLPTGVEEGLLARAQESVAAALKEHLESMGLTPASGQPWKAGVARDVLEALREELAEHGLNALPSRVTEDVVAHAEAVAERSDTASDMGEVTVAAEEERIQVAAARSLEALWEHLETHGAAGLPERVLAELGDRDALTAHVLESIWGHLEEHGLAGFPERIQADVAATGGGAGEGEAAGADLVSNVLGSIWGHLEEHGLEGFPARVRDEAREVSAEAAGALEARLARIEEHLGLDAVEGDGLNARVTRIEARLSGGGEEQADFGSEAFLQQVVGLALERVAEADTEQHVNALSQKVWRQIRAQLDEQLHGWEPTGWTDALRDLAQSAVDDVIDALDLQGLPDRVARYAVDHVRSLDHGSADATAQAEEAVARAVANLDYQALAERVATEATRPLMQAIDGRLQGLPNQVIEQTTERVLAKLQSR